MKIPRCGSKIQHVFLSLFCCLLLGACASTMQKANGLFERGDYVGSIRIITQKLDAKQDYPLQVTKKKWLQGIQDAIAQIEALPSTNQDQAILRLVAIHDARVLLGTGFYSNQFVDFNQRYPLVALKQDIAKLYYAKGKSIRPTNTEMYRAQAMAYTTGLSYADYQDIRQLAANANKAYKTHLAQDYYDLAEISVKAQQYKQASEQYAKARDTFKEYGHFKDAALKAAKYDKIWRTEQANHLYDQAALKANLGKTKLSLREAADLYRQAAAVYAPYGVFKNSTALADSLRSQGMIFVSYEVFVRNSRDYCQGSSSYSGYGHLASVLQTPIEKAFQAYPFKIRSRSQADVVVSVDYKNRFKERPISQETQKLSWSGADGVVHYYQKHTQTQRNDFDLSVVVDVRGVFGSSRDFQYESESSQTKISYSGDVPPNAKPSTSGSLLKAEQLCKMVEADAKRDMERLMDHVAKEARYL